MKKKYLIFPLIAFVLVIVVIIGLWLSAKKENAVTKSIRAVYYWRTYYHLNEEEKIFIRLNKINRMYVRFFDVDINENKNFSDQCAPVATIDFGYGEPDFFSCEVVPVVFITQEAIVKYSSFVDDMAHRLYAMCKKNGININEVQFDCDWTKSTQESYFQFLKEIRPALKKYFGKDLQLSSTIRLHQLAQTSPEVDYGVLMCYNTGDFKDYSTNNSILNIENVKPYVKYLKSYKLPLVLALPTYSWFVEFDKKKDFVKLNRQAYNINDTAQFKLVEGNIYEIQSPSSECSTKYVRYEQVSAETILEAKKLIKKRRGKMSIVLYHLDSKQLSKYSEDEIKTFFD